MYYLNRFIAPAVMLLSLLSFSSCHEEPKGMMVWDCAPLNAEIYLVNEAGENLLDPAVEGNYFGKEISVQYEDEIYEAQWNFSSWGRVYLPHFYGLIYNPERDYTTGAIKNPGKNHLTFGEFDAAKNQDISFFLKIEDIPETYHIEITHRYWHYDMNEAPEMKTTATINGTPSRLKKLTVVL